MPQINCLFWSLSILIYFSFISQLYYLLDLATEKGNLFAALSLTLSIMNFTICKLGSSYQKLTSELSTPCSAGSPLTFANISIEGPPLANTDHVIYSVHCWRSFFSIRSPSNVYPGTISPQRSLEYSGDQDSSSYNVEYLFIFFDQY